MRWDRIDGHEQAKQILQKHLASGEIAGGYLFAGPEGVGKRMLALEFAKAMNCTGPSGARPCDECHTCVQFAKGAHPDLHLLLPGGASDQVKIESVRQLLGRFALRPFNAAVQIALIDGADRLTEEAANALLKALEEPSRHAGFLLMTSQLADCLPTVVSRCQLIRCGPLSADTVIRLLAGAGIREPGVADAVARLSRGSASRALALAARWPVHEQTLSRLGADRPETEWLEHGLPDTRQDVARLLEDMAAWLRDLAMASAGAPGQVAHAGKVAVLSRQAAGVDVDRCVDTAFELLALRESLDQFVSPRLVASLAREKWLTLLETHGV
jgi:DNA polymerase-3 subunit delta'